MADFNFKILQKSKKNKARLGILKTPHGEVKTPAFIPCGTKATVKSLTPEDLNQIETQMIFVNTYHLVLSPGVDVIEKADGIHQFSKINKPIITDSGGFQVFSLGRRRDALQCVSTNNNARAEQCSVSTDKYYENEKPPHLVKITDDGVRFRSPIDGKEFFFTPEFSIEAQKKIGADFIVAFDECAYYKASYKYAKKAMTRTHQWARRSLAQNSKLKSQNSKLTKQELYGVIQGGCFEDLRKESARFISSLPFFGLAIGGVSVGETKKEMREQIKWVMDVAGCDVRPRHLLGIGEIDDIIDAVTMGIDTMDCVIPTRHARMGKLYKEIQSPKFKVQNYEEIDIFKSRYKGDLSPIDKGCRCYTCQHFTKAYLQHLFKQRELLGYRLATIHNLCFIEKLFEKIRQMIPETDFSII